MANEDEYTRKLMEGFHLVGSSESKNWEVRQEYPILVWIDRKLTWELPSNLPTLSQKSKNGLRAAVVCYGTSDDDPAILKQKHGCWKYCVERGYRIAHTYVEIVPPNKPEEIDDSGMTQSQVLMAALERARVAIEELNKRPKKPNPFELVEQRQEDIIVMHSPNLFVRKKEALADVLWCMPPIVFTQPWQETK